MSKPKQQYSGGMSNFNTQTISDATFSNSSQSTQTFTARNKGKKVIRDDRFDAM